jgi:hypothetical protein
MNDASQFVIKDEIPAENTGQIATPDEIVPCFDCGTPAPKARMTMKPFGDRLRPICPLCVKDRPVNHVPDPSVETLRKKACSYRGVYQVPGRHDWRAVLCHKGRKIFLGNYDTEYNAARVYDNVVYYMRQAGIESRAVLNFPGDYSPESKDIPFMFKRTEMVLKQLETNLLFPRTKKFV